MIDMCKRFHKLQSFFHTSVDSSPKEPQDVVASAKNAAPDIKAPDVKAPVENAQKVQTPVLCYPMLMIVPGHQLST